MRYAKIPERKERPFRIPRLWFREGRLCNYADRLSVPCEVLGTSREAALVFQECMKGLEEEELWFIALDEDCRARRVVRLASGDAGEVRLDSSVVFRALAGSGCEAFVLGHNHPSGDPLPSPNDWIATALVLEGAGRRGVELVDHVVMGDGVYVSMRVLNEPLFLRGLP